VSPGLEIGWFGKLPGSGDFVSRRIPRALQDALDTWLSRGVAELRAARPDDWRVHFAAAAAWNCAIPACVGGGATLIGVLVPSRDRVGRAFPLCAGIALPPDAATQPLLASADGWLLSLGHVVVEARDQALPLEAFDAKVQAIPLPTPGVREASPAGNTDILDVLGYAALDGPTLPMPLAKVLPWPELPTLFDADKPTSYWWTNPWTGVPLAGFTTDAGLAPSLLSRLMGPAANRGGNAA
jgi:type VI secretion system protein ImpM